MTVRNLEFLFSPKSVAFIGASPEPGSVGRIVTSNLKTSGFSGDLYLVNPKHSEIEGTVCYPSIAALPTTPDLAVIATPPKTIPSVIADLAAKGTRAAIVITAGIDTMLRRKMFNAARPTCMRIVGPNCIGLLLPRLGLNASFAHGMPLKGDLAFLSQSGALVTAVIDWAHARGIGFSKVVSMGDMADVDFGDLLDFLAGDPQSKAILLYVEQITSAPKFLSAARRAARAKPVIVLKSGRHASGAKAAHSHTGALSGADAVYDAAFRRAGLVRVGDLDALFSAAEILSFTPKLEGERLAILTNGGGAGVLAADRLADFNVDPADLSPETQAALNNVLPPTWSRGNPVDIIGDAGPERYEAALEILLADKALDAVLVINCPTALASSEAAASAVIRAHASDTAKTGRKKTLLTNWLGAGAATESRRQFAKAGIPTFDTPAEAIEGFMQLVAYRRSQNELMRTPPTAPGNLHFDTDLARSVIAEAIARNRFMLTEKESKAILSAYGIPVAETVIARDPDAVANAARKIMETTPACVIKILSDDISHKSDVGGVRLGLRSPEEAREAARAMLADIARIRPDAHLEGFTVEPMIERPDAHELIVGMSEDRTFGPTLLFGAGGTAVEVIKDTAHALPPLDLMLAHDAIRQTRISRLLQGYRNRPRADLDAIAEVLVRVSYMIANHPEIRELDINPLLADERGCIALDARVRVADAVKEPRLPLSIRPYPAQWEEDHELPRIGKFHLRPVRPEDEKLYDRFFEHVTPEDAHMRFFTMKPDRSHKFIARLTQIDYAREMAFVALSPDGELLGVSRLAADPDYTRAEYAVLVRSDLKGKGLGWLLMQHLIAYAREEGLQQLFGEILATNTTMLTMCQDLGFKIEIIDDDSTLRRATLQIGTTPQALRTARA